jgi:chemotaxis protein MotB
LSLPKNEHMKIFDKTLLVGALAIGTLAVSCKPIYKCGDPVPDKKKGGKRWQAVTMERDSLCLALSEEKATTASLMANKAELERRLGQQENINENQKDAFGRELGEKSREIQDKERMLREMQAIISRQDEMTRRLNETLRNALLGFASDEITTEIRDGKVYVSLSDKLLFKSGSAAVEAKGVDALAKVAEVLNSNPDIQILVEGHTDNVPIKTAQYKDNWDLSVARATSITRLMNEKYKVSATRLTASGRGEFYPRASNDTPEGKAQNRRTEIILSPKLDEIMNLLNGSSGGTRNTAPSGTGTQTNPNGGR